MRAPLLMLSAIIALATARASCSSEKEAMPPTTSSASTATTASPTTSATATATPSPVSSVACIPFVLDSIPEITFQYPSNWYRTTPGSPSTLTSWDPQSWHGPSLPPGGIGVSVDRIRLDDPALEPRPKDATDIALAGATGWDITYVGGIDSAPDTMTRVIALERNGHRYYLKASFGNGADESTFTRILNTFQFR